MIASSSSSIFRHELSIISAVEASIHFLADKKEEECDRKRALLIDSALIRIANRFECCRGRSRTRSSPERLIEFQKIDPYPWPRLYLFQTGPTGEKSSSSTTKARDPSFSYATSLDKLPRDLPTFFSLSFSFRLWLVKQRRQAASWDKQYCPFENIPPHTHTR